MSEYRIERDSMGELKVAANRLHGASTQRAVENFPISGQGLPPELIRALGLVKLAAARVNRQLGRIEPRLGDAVERAAAEVAANRLDEHFVVDVFQTGSGTSSHMNANEVIANRAIQILGGTVGDRSVHPNDHVNNGQSSNDVFPTAIHVAALEQIERRLLPALRRVQNALAEKARVFDAVVKIARTHLQDAVPIRLGQEFGGYARQLEHGIALVEATLPHLRELAIGGTAVGTGLNAAPGFGARVAAELAAETGLELREAPDHFEAQASRDAAVATSGALKTVAIALMKIANDIRVLGMGPRCGLAELKLPAVQPGSSIMPGKVNPVICESVVQVGAQIQANDLAVQLGGQWGQLDLNTMLPLIAYNLLASIRLLGNVADVFVKRCLDGLEADEERCRELVDRSLALVTSLNPILGYDRAAEVAHEAFESGRTVREVLLEKGLVPQDELERILDAASMTRPAHSKGASPPKDPLDKSPRNR